MIAVVIPSNRPDRFREWLNAWESIFKKHDVRVYLVEDAPVKTPGLNVWRHYCHEDIFSPYIPESPFCKGSSAIRSYGFLAAYNDNCNIIISMDDDCLPVSDCDPINAYWYNFHSKHAVSEYFDIGHTFEMREYMRGFPFRDRLVAEPLIQYGGWDNVPDLDARTQLAYKGDILPRKFLRTHIVLPLGCAFTGCGMNVAFKREATPLMYQPIMGLDRVGYDRWDDIWSGLIAKKICDHLRYPIVINGFASVNHSRASDPQVNLVKEQGGYEYNDVLWERLREIPLKGKTIIECYAELVKNFRPQWFGPAGRTIIRGMKKWLEMFGVPSIEMHSPWDWHDTKITSPEIVLWPPPPLPDQEPSSHSESSAASHSDEQDR